MDGSKYLQNIWVGLKVEVVQKADQRSGKTTVGEVAQILTNSAFHPHGIKVKLKSGAVGRAKRILSETDERGWDATDA